MVAEGDLLKATGKFPAHTEKWLPIVANLARKMELFPAGSGYWFNRI